MQMEGIQPPSSDSIYDFNQLKPTSRLRRNNDQPKSENSFAEPISMDDVPE